MRMKQLLSTATVAALMMTGPLSATALAQKEDPPPVPTGVGTGLVNSTLLGIDIGNLLNLDLLDDLSTSTIDPVRGEPISNAVFNPLKVTSSVLGEKSVGSVATSSTGTEETRSVGEEVGGQNVPLPIVSGLLTGTLSSIVDESGARSTLNSGASGLDLVGGLLGMAGTATSTFETSAVAEKASGLRELSIPSLEVLNLGSLLAGLGSPLENLPLVGGTGGVLGLLDPLGVQVEGEDGTMMNGTEVTGVVTGLLDSLTSLTADGILPTDAVTPTLCDTVDGVLGETPVLGGIGSILPAGLGDMDDAECTDVLALGDDLPVVGDLIATVEGLLDDLLGDVLGTLDVTSLLSVSDVNAGMVARASDSVETSESDVEASIGTLNVGNLPLLEGLDLTQGIDVLGGHANTASGALNGVLGIVGLPDLLDVDVLEINELIQPDGDYTNALSELRTLGVSLEPLVGILQAADSGPQPGSVAALGLVDGLVPTGGGIGGVGDVLGGVTSILTEGINIEVGTMASEGFFTPVAALPPIIVAPPAQPVTPPADGKLPKTGADTALPALLAVILAGAAVGIRRMVRPEEAVLNTKLDR